MAPMPTLLAGLVAATLVGGTAAAQAPADFPSRPVRIVVPFAPGGGTDILARMLESELPARLGQQIVVENKGGGGGTIGALQVVKSPADGHTLLIASSSTVSVVPTLYKNVPYDTLNDLEPVSLLAQAPVILVVHAKTGIKSVQELIERAKAKPGTLTYASGGSGSPLHLGMELFQRTTGTRMVHVPYKGTNPAQTDLLAGQVDLMFSGISASRAHIDRGTLVALGVTGDSRNKALPNVPTMGELGLAGVDAGTSWGILAPSGTPKPVIDRLSREIAAVMRQPNVVSKLGELGYTPIGSTPEDYKHRIKVEFDKWAPIITEIGITAQ